MKRKKKFLPDGKKESKIWRYWVLISACVFLFLRFFVDGLSYPVFNFFWNMYFFFLLAAQVLKDRLETSFYREEGVIFLFFLLSVISSGLSPVQNNSILYNAQVLAYICFLALIARNIREKDTETLYLVLIGAAFFITVYGIYQYFWGLEETRQMLSSNPALASALPPTFMSRLESDRIFATFVYPNIYAAFLLFVIPVAFFKGFSAQEKKVVRAVSIAVLVLAVINLFLTGSLGGMLICIFTALLIILFLSLKDRKKFWMAVFSLVLLLAVFFPAAYASGRLPKAASVVDRIRYWQAAAEIFYENPAMGAGQGNYRHYYMRFKHPGSMEAKHAHSVFFETLAETGIAGTLLLFAFFIMSLKLLFGKGRSSPLLSGLGFAFLSLLLHSMVDFNFINPSVAILFFLAAGSALVLKEAKPLPADSRLTKWLNGLIIITVFLTAANYARYTLSERNLLQARAERRGGSKLFYINRAAGLFPHNFEVYEKRGDVYLNAAMAGQDQESYAMARDDYYRSLALNPYSSRIYRKLAFIFEETGEMDKAEKMHLYSIYYYPAKKQYNLETAIFYKQLGETGKFEYYYEKSRQLTETTIEEAQINAKYIKWIESQR